MGAEGAEAAGAGSGGGHVVARAGLGRALLRGPSAARATLEGPVGQTPGKSQVRRTEMGLKLRVSTPDVAAFVLLGGQRRHL